MHHITRRLSPSRFRIPGTRALLGAALACAALLAVGGTAVADVIFGGSPPVAGQSRHYFTITARHSELNLNVPDASTKNGAPIIQWDGTTAMNGQWEYVTRQGAGGYSIRNRWSRQCLDVNSKDPGPVVQRPCDGSPSQVWIIDSASGVPLCSNYRNAWSGLDLNVSGGSTALGAQLIQWPHVHGAENAAFHTFGSDVVD